MRRTKIVATIGPTSREPDVLAGLIRAGMNVARIGLAHGSLEQHLDTCRRIRAAAAAADANIGVLVDLPGPKVRCAPFPEGGVTLTDGQELLVVTGAESSTGSTISVDYETVVEDVEIGDQLAIGDGNVVLSVEGKSADGVDVRVVRGSLVQGRPGLQIPSERLRVGTPTPEDLRLVDAFVDEGIDMVAVSFVRSAHDIRALGLEPAPRGPLVVAKIETQAAVRNLESIIDTADAVMVARGDLGLEFPLSELPHLQKHIIRLCVARGRPVITATQMLESMVTAPSPTRAEASDVANAVFDGSSALMLSGETAIGIDPVNAVATMAEIALRADQEFDHDGWLRQLAELRDHDPDPEEGQLATDAVTLAACQVAEGVGARAILCLSRTGFTVRSVARFRPDVPIFAFSPDEWAVRHMALSWGTEAAHTGEHSSAPEQITDALDLATRKFGLMSRDRVVVISGHALHTRATDTLRIMEIP